jgi:hypothetical protein
MSLLIRLPRALAHKAADHQDGPHPPADLEAVAARCEPLVLADRATHVPQAAVTSGMQRTVTVTPTGPAGWVCASDLGWGRRPKLHGMQACDLTRRHVGLAAGSAAVVWCWSRRGQAALAVLVAFFLGLVAGFLMAGYRVAGPDRLPLGRPGERPAGFGAVAGEPSAARSRGNPRRTR